MKYVTKFQNVIKSALQQGLTSCELASTATIALLATTFPIFGLTTIAVTAIGIKKKLNLPLLILITYSLEPLRYLVFLPLSKLGGQFLGYSDTLFYSPNLLVSEGNFWEMLQNLSLYVTTALLGWTVLAVIFSLPFYYFTKVIFAVSIPKHRTCSR